MFGRTHGAETVRRTKIDGDSVRGWKNLSSPARLRRKKGEPPQNAPGKAGHAARSPGRDGTCRKEICVKQQVKQGRRRISAPAALFSLVFEFLLSIVLCVLIVFYTPFFQTARKFAVSSIMETRTQQYLARLFFTNSQIEQITGETSNTSGTTNQNPYSVVPRHTGSTDISEYTVSGDQYTGFVLAVKDPTRVKVAMTQAVGVHGEDTSTMAERENAVAAINGGGYKGGASWNSSAQYPSDFVFHGGKVAWQDPDWSDTDKVNVIGLDSSGRLVVGSHSIQELQKLHVTEAVAFAQHQPLIVNGIGQYAKGEDLSRNPRTAVAQLRDGTILLIVLDGRQVGQFGATYYEVQQMLLKQFNSSQNPMETATILDGGGSTTMYYNGKVINHPSGSFGERAVATAFYVTQ